MRAMSTILCDPRKAKDPKLPGAPGSNTDFAFAFNNCNFSDRVLRIEIIPDFSDINSDGDGCIDWAHNCKRRREEIKKENLDAIGQCEEQIDAEDNVAYENEDDEVMGMIEESHVGTWLDPNQDGDDVECVSDGVECSDLSWSIDCSTVIRVKTIHISSPILAAKSPFFYKLFSNGMRESKQRHVTVRIHASEEAALMELLNFMYSNALTTTTPAALLDILMAADKFEVSSCLRYCTGLLQNLPMTCESALLYLDLPSSVLMAEAVQPLTKAAKQFLAARYKDISKFQEEIINLPLAGVEAILSSDDLQFASEDAVYEFVLKWSRTHYPKLEERQEILATDLGRLIRFPFMTCRKLKKVLTCNDLDPEIASKVVLEALFFKAEIPYRQRLLSAEEGNATYHRFVERAYKYRPVKVVEFEHPRRQCVVYLDLKRVECQHLFPAGRIYSQAFHLGGQGFFLSAHCNMDQQSSFHCFGLFLGMQEEGAVFFAVDYEFAARSRPTGDYVSKYKGNYTFTGGKAVGYRNLFGIPWIDFMADAVLFSLMVSFTLGLSSLYDN